MDYTTPIGTTASLFFTLTEPGPNTDTTYAVRAFDTVSGLEETNTDARVRIIVDGSGNDISGRPAAPQSLTATLQAAGGVRVTWTYLPSATQPTGFHVYAGTPTVSYGSPVATVPFASGLISYSTLLSSLTPGSVYQIGVRAYNAVAEEPNAVVVTITPDNTAPAPVDNLSGSAVSTWVT